MGTLWLRKPFDMVDVMDESRQNAADILGITVQAIHDMEMAAVQRLFQPALADVVKAPA